MLIHQTTKQSDAIEKHITEVMSKLETEQCDKGTTMLILDMLAQRGSINLVDDEKPFLFKLIEKRMVHFTFEITDVRLILLLSFISKSAGVAVLYLWYLQYWCKKNNSRNINLDKLCIEVFPMGFFKEDDLKQVWLSQKVQVPKGNLILSDNLVDYPEAGHSIQF